MGLADPGKAFLILARRIRDDPRPAIRRLMLLGNRPPSAETPPLCRVEGIASPTG